MLKIDFHPSPSRFSDPTFFQAEVLNSHGACAMSWKLFGTVLGGCKVKVGFVFFAGPRRPVSQNI